MERYKESYGYWATTWWLMRRFARSPIELFQEFAPESLKDMAWNLMMFFILLCGPLFIPFAPIFAAWKQWSKRKAAAKEGPQQ